ncbi:uncharacterized protein [Cardiocondyla obscurior]|uniref:uncharacterized protein isoform X2 n=1 Tax=Cardiocondyla obscurior TaxID=286306 RepID=UPI00396561EB
MEGCEKESLGHDSNQQHHPLQQTTVKEDRCPFLSPTTPAWGDRNANEQTAEETNNNFSFSPSYLFSSAFPAAFKLESSTNKFSGNVGLTSIYSSIDSPADNESSMDATELYRKCKLCSNYVSTKRTDYVDHIIAHCTFNKSSYVEINYHLNGYADEELSDFGNEVDKGKGKKRSKISKPKYCSKCDFMATTKLSLWLHLREHFVRQDCSGYVCVKCPFATTFKHHMRFHWFSSHDDFKAFTCTECEYTCVSKSMLTSHMKTHSEVYQYNCGSCSYRTKFCNAMKKHLKDTLHEAGTMLNPDGTPNPSATIDVYGNKRGPRRKPYSEEKPDVTEEKPSTSGFIFPVSTLSTSMSSTMSGISSSPGSPKVPSPIQLSPRKVSPARIPVPRSNVVANVTTFNKPESENERSCPIVNPIASPRAKDHTPLPSPVFVMLCHLLSDIETRRDVDDEELARVFRLIRNSQKILSSSEPESSVEMIKASDIANGDSLYGVRSPEESSMLVDDPSTSTADEPSTSTADETSIFTLFSKPEQDETVPDEPLDLSMSSMTKTERRPQLQELIARSSTRRNKHSKCRMPYLTSLYQFPVQRRLWPTSYFPFKRNGKMKWE